MAVVNRRGGLPEAGMGAKQSLSYPLSQIEGERLLLAGVCLSEGGCRVSAFGEQTFSEYFKDRPTADLTGSAVLGYLRHINRA